MLTGEDLNKVESEIKVLQMWVERHSGYKTLSVRPQEQNAIYELVLMLISKHRTLQQQNKQMKEALEVIANMDLLAFQARSKAREALQGGSDNDN